MTSQELFEAARTGRNDVVKVLLKKDVDIDSRDLGGMSALQTEFEFTLPRGYVDGNGTLHRRGRMRLATAIDEIAPLRDPRVRQNQAYLVILLLSRVITRLGTIENVTALEIENLFTGDLAYLQRFYRQVNEHATSLMAVTCPQCSTQMEVDIGSLGGSPATPSDGSTRR